MPRRPNTPCASCGRLVWPNYRSKTAPTCRACGQRAREERPPAPVLDVTCVICGRVFQTARAASRACSRKCGGKLSAWLRSGVPPHSHAERRATDALRCARRRAALAEQLVEVVDPRVVFERDGWRCHLCGDPVDPALSGRARMGATLDHVIPLSAGGEHSYANVATAHRACNSAKGTRTLEAGEAA